LTRFALFTVGGGPGAVHGGGMHFFCIDGEAKLCDPATIARKLTICGCGDIIPWRTRRLLREGRGPVGECNAGRQAAEKVVRQAFVSGKQIAVADGMCWPPKKRTTQPKIRRELDKLT